MNHSAGCMTNSPDPNIVVSGQEVQAPGSETQEDQGNAPPAQQAWRESAHKETAEERPPLLHAQICCQSLMAVCYW